MEPVENSHLGPPSEEIKKLIYHSIIQFLSNRETPVSRSEIKELLEKTINLIPDLEAHWAEINRFGKNKMILHWKKKVMLIDMEEILESIDLLWNQRFDI
ncbi:hypothetical protein KQY10_02135 [Leptospira interrogans]|uniref:Uncharacterized protein n=1 Tax=Leptospira interrogans serovar Hardjo str. Norma TaxID=1279460 RepID=A0A0M3TLS5_LEPIR|nr:MULTISPECIES: hypothetical protein [Leptospira]EMN72365.1 hypothetical protein LEP1GSC100_3390 [Leptospira interrogans serovar Bataviae str. UI 08561]ALE39605.1 hypothetical protein G436_2430 [Leptospira interrogans serovar Hardjo str. Norma]ALO00705.1 hypothetical protein LIH_10090 [Leptospira interrogans serovar Hardjo-prajitno]EJP04001.1 hypothetical protein LEP1GSC007_3112 [Leptospira interrogans serovar Bulgarica str. Mallika]EKO08388.1 hypothetical protein LEP1GSC077_1427 [Leptospira 